MDLNQFSSTQRRWLLEVVDSLNSALDLRTALANAHEGLCQLIPVDALALCVSRPGPSLAYDWLPLGLPDAFPTRYAAEMAPHDFVQRCTTRAPNTVLRDSEMVSRAELLRNPMHALFRELGQPLEQCMSVALSVSPS